ncbi:thioredoxin family protein [Methanosarcina sp.]|uniref:thioredoxin family protein n=1 Tax=Methanosarcina sp. TaxID=2213 RepID=UPI002AB978B1|nr:thioredoxin family protein [Methanosarcina sp.]MDY9925242.1 thioredoxin family protein [Methanosarcina sp.]
MKLLDNIQIKKRLSFSFPLFLKKSLFLLVIFCFLLFSSGCADVDDSGSESGLIEVKNLSQIDEALVKGPVVLKLGSKSCIPCQKQEQVLSELLPLYKESASIMIIDVKEHPEFAARFGVRVIPDTCVITDIEDGKYMYIRQDGSKSSERASARFLGVADKETLSETLEKALESRNIEE